eukprot:SAG31_NODE_663_length_13021_cov_9.408296_1_plen_69_part_00
MLVVRAASISNQSLSQLLVNLGHLDIASRNSRAYVWVSGGSGVKLMLTHMTTVIILLILGFLARVDPW